MATLSKFIFRDFLRSLSKEVEVRNLVERDEEINRLYLLGVRFLHLCLANPEFSLKLGFESNMLIIGRLLLLKNVEDLVDIIKELLSLYSKPVRVDDKIKRILGEVYSIYSEMMDHFVEFENEEEIVDVSKRVLRKINELSEKLPVIIREYSRDALNYHYILSVKEIVEKLKTMATIMNNYLFYHQSRIFP